MRSANFVPGASRSAYRSSRAHHAIGQNQPGAPQRFTQKHLLQGIGRQDIFIRIVGMHNAKAQRQARRGHQVEAGDEIVMGVQNVILAAAEFGTEGPRKTHLVAHRDRRMDDVRT